jgi:hypothetical protein
MEAEQRRKPGRPPTDSVRKHVYFEADVIAILEQETTEGKHNFSKAVNRIIRQYAEQKTAAH